MDTFTWDDFFKAFYVRFFSRTTRQDLAERLINLYQGPNMSVAEYHSRFLQLGQFAPQSTVPSEAAMTWKFQRGLRPEYRTQMASHMIPIVEEANDAALKLNTGYRRSNYRSR